MASTWHNLTPHAFVVSQRPADLSRAQHCCLDPRDGNNARCAAADNDVVIISGVAFAKLEVVNLIPRCLCWRWERSSHSSWRVPCGAACSSWTLAWRRPKAKKPAGSCCAATHSELPMRRWLAVAAGSGVQVLCVAMATDVLGALGFASPASRGAALTSALLLYPLRWRWRIRCRTRAGMDARRQRLPEQAAGRCCCCCGAARLAHCLAAYSDHSAWLNRSMCRIGQRGCASLRRRRLWRHTTVLVRSAIRSARWRSALGTLALSLLLALDGQKRKLHGCTAAPLTDMSAARSLCSVRPTAASVRWRGSLVPSAALIYDAFDAACVPRAAACYLAWPTTSNAGLANIEAAAEIRL